LDQEIKLLQRASKVNPLRSCGAKKVSFRVGDRIFSVQQKS
jgi:hypothetical protein